MKGGNPSPSGWCLAGRHASMRPPFMKGGNRLETLAENHPSDLASMRPPFMKGGNAFGFGPRY